MRCPPQGMGMSPEMMSMMSQMDFSQEKVQAQFSELGLKPEDVIQKVLATPDLAAGFSNPKVQQAIFDISQNPMVRAGTAFGTSGCNWDLDVSCVAASFWRQLQCPNSRQEWAGKLILLMVDGRYRTVCSWLFMHCQSLYDSYVEHAIC